MLTVTLAFFLALAGIGVDSSPEHTDHQQQEITIPDGFTKDDGNGNHDGGGR